MPSNHILVAIYPITDKNCASFIKEIKQSVRSGRWDITTTSVKEEAADFGEHHFIIFDWLKENRYTCKFVIDDDHEKSSFNFFPVEIKYTFSESPDYPEKTLVLTSSNTLIYNLSNNLARQQREYSEKIAKLVE